MRINTDGFWYGMWEKETKVSSQVVKNGKARGGRGASKENRSFV